MSATATIAHTMATRRRGSGCIASAKMRSTRVRLRPAPPTIASTLGSWPGSFSKVVSNQVAYCSIDGEIRPTSAPRNSAHCMSESWVRKHVLSNRCIILFLRHDEIICNVPQPKARFRLGVLEVVEKHKERNGAPAHQRLRRELDPRWKGGGKIEHDRDYRLCG